VENESSCNIHSAEEEKNKFIKLPNGLTVKHQNKYETDFIYKEIFVENVYLKNGITIQDGDCIFDIGANIGMFSLYAFQNYNNIRVFACEPSPELCEIIRFNTKDYEKNINVLQCGISDRNREASFTFYPGYSIISGFNTDFAEDFKTLKAGVLGSNDVKDEFEDSCLNEMVKQKLNNKVEYKCRLKSISSIIDEYGIKHIDLLKVDAEKCEIDILKGIEDKDWHKIKQLVMELHSLDSRISEDIRLLLLGKGFVVTMEEEKGLKGSGIINLYAVSSSDSSEKTEKERIKGAVDDISPAKNTGIVVSANFTAEPLLEGLQFWKDKLQIPIVNSIAPYNQVFQQLLNPQSTFVTNSNGMNVILLKLDDWLRYREAREDGCAAGTGTESDVAENIEYMNSVMNDFIRALQSYSGSTNAFTLLVLCPLSPNYSGDSSYSSIFNQLETRLDNCISKLGTVELMKASSRHSIYGVENIFDPLSDSMGHIPYTIEYYNYLATLIIRRLYSLKNSSCKALMLDCDNTLWEGVCGESGADGVRIDGLYGKFQRFLVGKCDEGFLLCLCSKNNEEDVWEVFNKNRGIILKKQHITDSRINWLPKSENIKSLGEDLKLGIDSFIFIDDNPVECAEVRANCPEVLTIEWPPVGVSDSFLDHIWMLDNYSVSEEDKKRQKSYLANLEREKLRKNCFNLNDFIEGLELDIKINLLAEEKLDRVSQLTNRTNQFNLTTIRRSKAEIAALLKEENFECRTVEVKDRFGDYGTVGAVITKVSGEDMEIDTFILSCRVLGRSIEYRIMEELGVVAREKSLKNIKAVYVRTDKNEPIRNFMEQFAGKYAVSAAEAKIEYVIPVDALSNICNYITSIDMTSIDLKNNSSEKAKNNCTVFSDVRKKEKLLTDIFRLADIKVLSEEIEMFRMKNLEQSKIISEDISTKSDRNMAGNEIRNLREYDNVLDGIKDAFSISLGIQKEKLDENVEIDRYINRNSLKIVEITSRLNSRFGNVQPTLLFEHKTIKSIAKELTGNEYNPAGEIKDKAGAVYSEKTDSDEIEAKKEDAGKTNDSCGKLEAIPIEESSNGNDIAIIGINGKFPKAADLEKFWENLAGGICSIDEVPEGRWDVEQFYDENGGTDKSYCKWGGFLEGIDRFEASFFNISPREAELMDPQQRLFMEAVWGLIEDAGYTPETVNRNTGVFVGLIASDYNMLTSNAAIRGESAYRNSDYYQVPNRISYFYDFHGPSIAVDTACSSAGTALHLACTSLQKGECSTAIVGGINLFLHPSRFIQYSQMKVLSHDDKCRPFGDGATGTLYGEGVGAVMLKPLGEAIRNGDHIYAVIKGSALNSGGRTNGFTVPSPAAQEELISKALSDSNIDPRTISYVEAHGTGTPLGDPIEIRGLTGAYRKSIGIEGHEKDTQYCAIGSVKSNIGHLESGSTVAGLIKILLQMKHGVIVPSLNALRLNPLIAFEQTPFKVQNKAEEWKRSQILQAGKTVTYPRRAGLSSFGAGGVNTHFILEEYTEGGFQGEAGTDSPLLFIFSSRTEEKLKQYVTDFTAFLRKSDSASNAGWFKDIAYTLQVGRMAMDERLAVIAESPDELIGLLSRYSCGESGVPGIYTGSIKKRNKGIELLLEGKEGEEYLTKLIKHKNLDKLSKLWTEGTHIDWKVLYSGSLPKRVPLPGYKFMGERYWVQETKEKTVSAVAVNSVFRLHTMLDCNVSNFNEQCFEKVLSSKDIFLKDHVVDGQMVLPGVAYFEMARVAGSLSAQGREIKSIKNIVWVRPVIVNEDEKEFYISLAPCENSIECIAWTKDQDGEKVINAEWQMELQDGTVDSHKRMELSPMISMCNSSVSKSVCYELLASIGYRYGKNYQVIKEVYFNNDMAVSVLELQGRRNEDTALLPFLLDGSLQTITVWISNTKGVPAQSNVPFTVGEVEIYKPLTPVCYAKVAEASSNTASISDVKKYDVGIFDEDGNLLVAIRDYYARPFQKGDEGSAGELAVKETYFESRWEEANLPENLGKTQSCIFCIVFDSDDSVFNPKQQGMVLVKPGSSYRNCGEMMYEINPASEKDYKSLINDLKAKGFICNTVVHLWAKLHEGCNAEKLENGINEGMYSVQYLCKALSDAAENINVIFAYFPHEGTYQPQFASVGGMVRSICRENPRLSFKVISLYKEGLSSEQLAGILSDEIKNRWKGVFELKYQHGKRFVKEIRIIEPDSNSWGYEFESRTEDVYKENGVYLITGGLGGLGFIFASHLAKKLRVRLILTGRSKLSGDSLSRIRELESFGAEVMYVQSDISGRESVKNLISKVKSGYGRLDGIIHCAGAIRDSLLINKTREETETVIAAKVWGTLLLDEETKDLKLDFFVMFSSTSSVAGHIGQSDYAFANRFLDEFACLREAERQKGKRSGRTVSISWPWWKSGGMRLDDNAAKQLQKLYGLKGMETEQGLIIFDRALQGTASNIGLFIGNPEKVTALLNTGEEDTCTVSTAAGSNASYDMEAVEKLVGKELTRDICDILKLPADGVRPDKKFSSLGFDSITFTNFSNLINDRYNTSISPASFYEYQTLGEFSSYLCRSYGLNIGNYYRAINAKEESRKKGEEPVHKNQETVFMPGRFGRYTMAYNGFKDSEAYIKPEFSPISNEPVAIIGIGGIFPQSEDINAFWENIVNGKDLITEIPEDRWKWKDYYGKAGEGANKTDVKWGGFIKDVDKFDASFFGISPREAAYMDPQQRIFLQTVWRAIEDAGYSPSMISGSKTGLFVGSSINDYSELIAGGGLSIDPFMSSGINNSIIANRVSFLLNLRGPSEVIDTACSSSLVAVKHALDSIRRGECRMAVAGGVNIILSPKFHISFRMTGMLSPDGRCKTFDKDANGYVRGEGAGAILLKPLKQAVEDGDNIYAVIKGAAENHGGYAQSLTAPNPKAQAELLVSAYRDAQIPVNTVSYIEAHGTGTSLGDPIEMNGLKEAFERLSEESVWMPEVKHYCGIGAVKTNIGHLEAASGIAGIIKVILAMKHKTLPASLHFNVLNPYIELDNSPFYVVNETKEWKPLKDKNGTSVPRRAGISSFGFGGTNAHIVLEEYVPQIEKVRKPDGNSHIIVLSARSRERLAEYAKKLHDYLEKVSGYGNKNQPDIPDITLEDMAYTLQIGREAMPERLALVASNIAEVKQMLSLFCQGISMSDRLFAGRADSKETVGVQLESTDIAITDGIITEEYAVKIAKAWVEGISIDWKQLYKKGQLKRISMPTYPFEKQRCWLPLTAKNEALTYGSRGVKTFIHPLLDENKSNLKRIKFSKQLDGSEFYLSDHLIGGHKVLPGVTYLEMALAAGESASERKVAKIRNAVWIRPIAVREEPCNVDIILCPDGDLLEYKVCTKNPEGQVVVNAQGKLVLKEEYDENTNSEIIDIGSIKARAGRKLLSSEFYNLFEVDGSKYLHSFQSVRELVCGHNEALSFMQIPKGLKDSYKDFTLHPSIMDGALQTIIGMMSDEEIRNGAPYLPFSIEEVEILNPLTEKCYVYVTGFKSEMPSSEGLTYHNIVIADENGKTLVKIKNYCVRSFKGQFINTYTAGLHEEETVCCINEWVNSPADLKNFNPGERLSEWDETNPRTILLYGGTEGLSKALKQKLEAFDHNDVRIITVIDGGEGFRYIDADTCSIDAKKQESFILLVSELSQRGLLPGYIIYNLLYMPQKCSTCNLDDALNSIVYPLFYLNRELLTCKPSGKVRSLYVYPSSDHFHTGGAFENEVSVVLLEALNGLARTVCQENSKFSFKTMEMPCPDESNSGMSTAEQADLLVYEMLEDGYYGIKYGNGNRYVKKLKEIQLKNYIENSGSHEGIRHGGVYLITGGTGGLGRIIARHLAEKYKARLILTGRSAEDDKKTLFVHSLEDAGAEVMYVQADISNAEDITRLIGRAKERFGKLNGIFHCAGIIKDELLANKNIEAVHEVLAPKVKGTVYLDLVTKDMELDIFVLFSSVSAFAGNTGQSDYAYANGFMDSYAGLREKLRHEGKRNGKTISIGWPYWKDGGMKLNRENERFLSANFGMEPMPYGKGLDILEKSIAVANSWLGVASGDAGKIRKWLASIEKRSINDHGKRVENTVSDIHMDDVKIRFEADVMDLFSNLLQVSRDTIKPEDDLKNLGMNSIIFVDLSNRLNELFGLDIMPSMFFEYSTPGSIVAFLYEEYRERINRLYERKILEDIEKKSISGEMPFYPQSGFDEGNANTVYAYMKERSEYTKQRTEPIAIIGMNGIMPGSRNLNEFWNALEKDVDMVTGMPEERWNAMGCRGQKVNNPNEICAEWGGFLKNVDRFDAGFFNISRKEAEFMDPQQRLFMEIVWKTIEDAGYRPSELSGTFTGVFAGVANSDYYDVVRDSGRTLDAYVLSGKEHSILANRISFLLNLHGPSEPVNTACSSALAAIYRAIEAIRNGNCRMAIAGGVNILTSRAYYFSASDAGILSKDGRCKTFDRNANGYVRGEGCGALLLKRLSDAENDGDNIYAVIRGCAVNHGGRTSSLTAPSASAQADLLVEAYTTAQVDPTTVSYIETHGTGTELGDPIEIEGLKKAFNELYHRCGKTVGNKAHIGLGSVKTSIGHLESAAGIAGVIKILLSMKNKVLPGNIHLNEVNPYIRLEGSPFYLVKEKMQWKALMDNMNNPIPRRAGVSSFGFGGANAHLIIEEYREKRQENNAGFSPQIIVLSAKNTERLKDYTKEIMRFAQAALGRSGTQPVPGLKDMAYTLQVGREPMRARLACIASSLEELVNKLNRYCSGYEDTDGLYVGLGERKVKTGQEMIDYENLNIDLVSRLWVSGAEIDWRRLYRDCKPRRISLPTYPFAGERYWADPIKTDADSAAAGIGEAAAAYSGTDTKYDTHYYCEEWAEKSIYPFAAKKAYKPGVCILIFDNNNSMKPALRKCLSRDGVYNAALVSVEKGTGFSCREDGAYTINPASSEDYTRLFDSLSERKLLPYAIIHLWSREDFSADRDAIKGQLDISVFSMFCITRNLMERRISDNVRIAYLYFCRSISERPQFEAVSGFIKTAALENSNTMYKSIEIQTQSGELESVDTYWLAEALLMELENYDGAEIRYEGNLRQVKRYIRQVQEDAAEYINDETQYLKAGGVYLITGGLGGLGLIFAEHLAKREKIKLVLSGRSELDEKKKNKLEDLKKFGAEVVYIKGDISDYQQTRLLIDHIKKNFGGIDGIIHSAGIIQDGYIIKKAEQSLYEVLAPKVFGTVNLDWATKEENLDFFVMFSSVASAFGNAGQSDYAYANAFMDNFAQMREGLRKQNKRKGKTLSISWSYWQDGGMSILPEEVEIFTRQSGIKPFPKADGIKAFERCMKFDNAHYVAAYGNKIDMDKYVDRCTTGIEGYASCDAGYKDEAVPSRISRDMLEDKIRKYLRTVFEGLFGLKEGSIEDEVTFEEYGIDSILIKKFNFHIENTFTSLPKTLLFEYSNIKELADYLIENHMGEAEKLFAGNEKLKEKSLKAEMVKQEVKDVYEASYHKDINGKADSDIAIIGMSGRYPMADNLDEFWENIRSGKDCITEIPKSRWDYNRFYHPDRSKVKEGKIYCKWGGFVNDADKFDAAFFNISPREAEAMDPQERLFLQTVWETLEDSGYAGRISNRNSKNNAGSDIGVFVGVTTNSYPYVGMDICSKGEVLIPFASPWSIANRVSFFFGFSGPSMPVDTACSSSLAAVYMACESIKRGECSMAIAGGVNLYLHPFKYLQMCSSRMLSPRGRCFSFGEGGDGFVPGEGVGALLLKPLSQAVKDGDNIYGVVKGGYMNHGGSTNGFMVPNPRAQANVISKALENAGINPSTISYIEAHGTGTELGDPIEIEGISRVFRQHTDKKQYCSIGSVKSNIGHLESAAGISGITKILLQMKNREIAPSLHAEKLNPNIDFESSPFCVQQKLSEWKQPVVIEGGREIRIPRRAGISSFGAGGTNVHIVIEEYEGNVCDKTANKEYEDNKCVIVLSASDEESLKLYAGKLRSYIEGHAGACEAGKAAGSQLLGRLNSDIGSMVCKLVNAEGDDIDYDTDISEYGIDIIGVSSLCQMIDEKYGIYMSGNDICQNMTIRSLTEYICEHFREEAAGHYAKDISDTGEICWPFTLRDFAYTLQTGRAALEERLSFIASDMKQLLEKLKRYSIEGKNTSSIYTGSVTRVKGGQDKNVIRNEEIIKLADEGKLERLAELWSSGTVIDWNLLNRNHKLRKLSLPTYPFKKQRFWLGSHLEAFEANKSAIGGAATMERETKPEKVQYGELKYEKEDKLTAPAVSDTSSEKHRLVLKSPGIKQCASEGKKQLLKESDVKTKIKEILAAVLYMKSENIDEDKPFIDLGLDSILGVEMINVFNKAFNLSVRATKLYDYSTVTEFSRFALELLNDNNRHMLIEHKYDEIQQADERKNISQKEYNAPQTSAKPSLAFKSQSEASVVLQEENYGKPDKQYNNAGARGKGDIAVIGMSARLPGAKDTWELWEVLKNGECTIKEVPAERWDIKKHFDPDVNAVGKSYCKYGGFLKDIDKFDPLFFNISPGEAALIEPQQRILLQEAWRALENAAYSSEALNNMKCGVYVGVGSINEYNPAYMFNTSSILASRIAYFLNLRGPAVSVDTACSSSLVAIHMACRSLLDGEADMMLAGGISLYLTEKPYIQMCRAGMLSPDGKCKSFDDGADGFVPAEGVGVVVLKRLEKAIEDKDHIYAVIKGSGMNQDGRTNGITAPSARSQKELEIEVYEKSGINPETISYAEAHGTGTNLGDPIEFDALTEAFRKYTDKKNYCALGSIKTNLGHTSASAGVAAVIKVILSMMYGKIPPTLHYERPNRHIDLKSSPFYINTELKDWIPVEGCPARAVVSSFGFSGTNVHMVLEKALQTEIQKKQTLKPYYIVPVSATTVEALTDRVSDLLKWLRQEGAQNSIADISYTLFTGRSHFSYRLAIVAGDTAELKDKLEALEREGIPKDLFTNINDHKSSTLTPMFSELGKMLIGELQRNLAIREDEYREKLTALAELYTSGYDMRWTMLFENCACRKIPLPMYPFSGKKYWLEQAYHTEEDQRYTGRKEASEPGTEQKEIRKIDKEEAVRILTDVLLKRKDSNTGVKKFRTLKKP